MPNAHCLMRTGLAPIRRSAGSSCATALMARPVKVFEKYSVNTMVMATATANTTSVRCGMRISPKRRLLPMYDASTMRWSTPKARIRPTSMISATPKKNAMPRTPASVPRFSKAS